MNHDPICRLATCSALTVCVSIVFLGHTSAADFHRDLKPLLREYCFDCHSGEEAHGGVDFGSIHSSEDVDEAFELWESMVELLRSRSMPPEDASQPTEVDRRRIEAWYRGFIDHVKPRPAVFMPRRLSVIEYRNSLRSVLGFDLQVDVIEAEQTVAQRSMVIKLLPEDPPGESGFKNDTHDNPLTPLIWDQYSYLVDAALEELFSNQRRKELQRLVGPVTGEHLSRRQAETLIRNIFPLVIRRDVDESELRRVLDRLEGKQGAALESVLKSELETVLMSPSFIYRGLRASRAKAGRQPVDAFELAERLSYFLWADMPDPLLMRAAADGSLDDPRLYAEHIDRMLESPKAKSLSEVFLTEWLSLGEIEHVSDNPPVMTALLAQPIDFFQYLLDHDRPLIELIDSRTTFANRYTAKMYRQDSKQLTKDNKQRGIEQKALPNQRIRLEHAAERGGVLTMPGILAMNKGPILRGTWVLERILGEELPDPPANVGQVRPNARGEKLTFRERFEQHRSNASCAVCHDKIDPLGFALQAFGDDGQYMLTANDARNEKRKKSNSTSHESEKIDTSGRLPSGERFDGIKELKQILTTTQRDTVIGNIVKRTMSYALCRKLTVHDMPIVNSITQKMIETDGTWRDLLHEVANCMPFRETMITDERS